MGHQGQAALLLDQGQGPRRQDRRRLQGRLARRQAVTAGAATDVAQVLGHIPALRRYARLLAGDAATADDLVQDTLERACAKWSLWRPGTDLRAWLMTLMHNLYLNRVRDWRHDDGHAALDEGPEPSHQPLAHAPEMLDLQRALERLTPPLRSVLLLVTVEEYTYAEAAEILQVPVGTIMSRLHRARETVRLSMDAPGDAQRTHPLHLVKR
ncbi:RNA polymerase subunit sigma-24 [Achromobacter aloeverae]|uniref:RNA polymerase subunit sigma-24 n=1 Tax=Achromobacter aloeverae TaxID=1750518 RepID=A0A4Q1HGI2_9BURK|nr:RNA polymerase subunit sigma-24 [Achromobacter aloeverae]